MIAPRHHHHHHNHHRHRAGRLAAKAAAVTPAIMLAILAVTSPAAAQSISVDLGGAPASGGATGHLVQLTALITLLSLAPSLLVVLTGFTRIIIVLSLLRSALGAQGTPPNPVLTGLALFLTFFVMQPTFDRAWQQGIAPMMAGHMAEAEAIEKASLPFHDFMATHARPDDVRLFQSLARLPERTPVRAAPWRTLVPAFLIGELRRAFEMGFLLYLPFLVIDIVVSSVLMSLGMMMLPPSAISLPFKLIFFVMIDGWHLVSGSLVQSFGQLAT